MKIFRTKYKWLNFWLDVAVIFAVMLVLAYIFFWPIRVGGNSMAPAFAHNDRLIASRFLANFGSLQVGDFVLVQMGETTAVKRIAATPGDHLVLTAGALYINGIRADWPMHGESAIAIDTVLGDGMYFILGDNLSTSTDSRHRGPIENRHILAKIIIKYFPLTDIKFY